MADLRNSHRQSLRSAILSDQAIAALVEANDDQAIADYMNQPADPAVSAWRENFAPADLFEATKLTDYIARNNGERAGYDLLMSRESIDATRKAVRDAILEIFAGTSNNSSKAAIVAAMQEAATRAQVAIGGTSRTVGPDAQGFSATALVRRFSGQLSAADVSILLRGGSGYVPE